MPFRARMKRAFTRSSSSSSDTSRSLSRTETRGIGDPKVYQPGEPMPRPKYRAPVDKKHKAMLDAYSFGNNSRRKSTSSQGSLYSPGGSRLPSRHNSVNMVPVGWLQHTSVGKVEEAADDDADISNVSGASRRHSKDLAMHAMTAHHNRGGSFAGLDAVHQADTAISANTTAPDHSPFSESDFHLAITNSVSKPTIETL